MDLAELLCVLWRGKWTISGSVIAFAVLAAAYALFATPWYRAEVLLVPAEGMTSEALLSQFGGLASLAGISVGDVATAEPIAVLESREFAREFIEDQKLLTVLLADDWDGKANRWKSDDPADWPDWRDAVEVFTEDVLSVRENTKTGLVTVSVEWTDADVAADWANLLVKRLNARMRGRALSTAQSNVDYLRSELSTVQVVSLQQSIGRLLESELQKLMLARGSEQYSFRVIDPAEAPKQPSRPLALIAVAVGVLVGLMVGCCLVIAVRVLRWRRVPLGSVGGNLIAESK
jgi:uncharacterized protein involved in exopolysaccharide biosynthesis